MMSEPEYKLPNEILSRAVITSGGEYGWRKADIIQAIEAASQVGLATIGGQVQFRLPGGTCELYWLNYDSTAQQLGETWIDYVARSRRECIEGIKRLLSEVDIIKESTIHFDFLREKAEQGVNLKDYLIFVVYFADELDEQKK